MEVSYKHDVAHSFLVIGPEGEVDTRAYPIRMVLGNEIPGLLPCRLQRADGKVLFYYEITARQPLFDIYKKLTHGELKNIYLEFLRIFGELDMYLLDTGQLLLDPEYIYLDKEDNTLYLCYLPGYDKPAGEQLRVFTEYLLTRIEHQDPRGVMLGYGIYRLLVEESFQVEAVSEILNRSEREQEDDPRTPADLVGEETMYTDDQDILPGEADEKGMGRKDLVFLSIGLFLAGGVVAVRQMGYLPDVSLPMMFAVLLGAILLAALMVWKGREKEEEREGGIQDGEEMDWGTEKKGEGERCVPQEEETVVLYKSPAYGCPVLVCEETGQAPPVILDRDMVVIGKMEGVTDVRLDRPAISRIHARIQKKEQGYWIADLDSKNGTFVNGKKLEKEEERLLQAEDLVVFADMSYRFRDPVG